MMFRLLLSAWGRCWSRTERAQLPTCATCRRAPSRQLELSPPRAHVPLPLYHLPPLTPTQVLLPQVRQTRPRACNIDYTDDNGYSHHADHDGGCYSHYAEDDGRADGATFRPTYTTDDFWEVRQFKAAGPSSAPTPFAAFTPRPEPASSRPPKLPEGPRPAARAPRPPPKLPVRDESQVASAKALIRLVGAVRAALCGAALLARAAALAGQRSRADSDTFEAAATRATVARVVAAAFENTKVRAALEIEAREASASVVAKAITRIKLRADLRAALAPFLDDDAPEAPLPAAAAAAEEQDEAASVASDVMQVRCCFLLAPAGLSHNSLATSNQLQPPPYPPHPINHHSRWSCPAAPPHPPAAWCPTPATATVASAAPTPPPPRRPTRRARPRPPRC
jgi:hypothetical protein